MRGRRLEGQSYLIYRGKAMPSAALRYTRLEMYSGTGSTFRAPASIVEYFSLCHSSLAERATCLHLLESKETWTSFSKVPEVSSRARGSSYDVRAAHVGRAGRKGRWESDYVSLATVLKIPGYFRLGCSM